MAARSSSSSTRARRRSRRGNPNPNPDTNPDTNPNTNPNTITNTTPTRYSSLIVATTKKIMAYQVVHVRATPGLRPPSPPSTTTRPP